MQLCSVCTGCIDLYNVLNVTVKVKRVRASVECGKWRYLMKTKAFHWCSCACATPQRNGIERWCLLPRCVFQNENNPASNTTNKKTDSFIVKVFLKYVIHQMCWMCSYAREESRINKFKWVKGHKFFSILSSYSSHLEFKYLTTENFTYANPLFDAQRQRI